MCLKYKQIDFEYIQIGTDYTLQQEFILFFICIAIASNVLEFVFSLVFFFGSDGKFLLFGLPKLACTV